MEKEYLTENTVTIYNLSIDKHFVEYEKNSTYFNDLFGEIDHVPIVYWLFEGSPKNNLPIVDEENQARILKCWISDNLDYYK